MSDNNDIKDTLESDIRDLIEKGEDSNCEFKQIEFRDDKPISPKPDELVKEIIAFANTRGGILLCGVRDDGSIQGISKPEQAKSVVEMLTSACRDRIRPPLAPTPNIRICKLDQGFVIFVRIGEGMQVYGMSGRHWNRIGSSKRIMESEEIAELVERRKRLLNAPDKISTNSLHFKSESVRIFSQCEGEPLAGVQWCLLFPNRTCISAKTDSAGKIEVRLYRIDLPMTIFAAAPGFSAFLSHDWNPKYQKLTATMESLDNGGSVIFERSGHIPGLSGRLNPILDSINRTYMYADNIAINGGNKQQPVSFTYGKPINLMDSNGVSANIVILCIVGNFILIDYTFA